MPLKYIDTPTPYVVAQIGKSGSSAILRVIVRDLYPELLEGFTGEIPGQAPPELPPGAPSDQHNVLPSYPNPPLIKQPDITADRVILLPVRDPVERFRSACAQKRLPGDEALELLEEGEYLLNDFHFTPTVRWLPPEGVHCTIVPFNFPENLQYLQTMLNLGEIPVFNSSEQLEKEKPDLTDDEIERVKKFFAEDFKLRS